MSSITGQQAFAILRATEGAKGNLVTLSVPNYDPSKKQTAFLGQLGTDTGKNSAGFSFGTVQLDQIAVTVERQEFANIRRGMMTENTTAFRPGD